MRSVALALCLLLCAGAQAQESALPQAVTALCAAAHPGYAVAAQDGWGDEERGQFALVLSRDGDNILCMAEKAEADAAYALTVDNTNAVHDGDALPHLLIDGGGDALFYSYVEGDVTHHYHSEKRDGTWQAVDVTVYAPVGEGYRSVVSGVRSGKLSYEAYMEDENGNILASEAYMPVSVSEAFAARMQLACFDIRAYTADPDEGMNEAMLPGLADTKLEAGETLEGLDIQREALVLLVRGADGLCRVRVVMQDDFGERTVTSRAIGVSASLDAMHAGEGQLIVYTGGVTSAFRKGERQWRLAYTTSQETIRYGYDCVVPVDAPPNGRNDGFVYGASPWGALETTDFAALPETFAQAVAQIDRSAYALVRNPDPADRLHLRAAPDKGAQSLGKFYNRTPVRVLERQDAWTRVQIGNEETGFTGYMMTKYLVFDEADQADVACAFPLKRMREEEQALLEAPQEGAFETAVCHEEDGYQIIGVSGDAWYVVMLSDGSVGYAPQSAFRDGNG